MYNILGDTPIFMTIKANAFVKSRLQGIYEHLGRVQLLFVLMSVTPDGYQVETTGNSRIKLQRPLLTNDDEFFDDESQQYVSIEQVLKTYIENIPAIISEFEALLA